MTIDVILENDKPRCQPTVHEMVRGDTVHWKSDVGAITIDFSAGSPFKEKPPLWTAAAGETTDVATVHSAAPLDTFVPRVSLRIANRTFTDQGLTVGGVKIKET